MGDDRTDRLLREHALKKVEKVLIDMDVVAVSFDPDGTVTLSYWVKDKNFGEKWDSTAGPSLVDAYNKLKEGVRE
jgi:hypothetical protein